MADEQGIDVEEAERRFLDAEKPQIVFDRTAEPAEVADVAAFLARSQSLVRRRAPGGWFRRAHAPRSVSPTAENDSHGRASE